MPKKYPKETKLDALVQLSMYKDTNTVHQLTGIPVRTLQRWRAQMQNKEPRVMSEKTSTNDTNPSQNTKFGHKNPNSRHKQDNSGHKNDKADNQPDTLMSSATASNQSDEKTYPYPIEEDEISNTDQYESFKHIRDRLMQHAQTLTNDLLNHPEEINRRSLALARILDRIMQLDELIPNHNPDKLIRFEYLYNGSVHNVPPWHNKSDTDDA